MFLRTSAADSSKVTKTPGSPSSIPAARKCTAKTVLPLPAVPEMRGVRFFCRPPLAMMSRLEIPVRSFSTAGRFIFVMTASGRAFRGGKRFGRPNFQAQQDFVLVGEITDDASQRWRQLLDQRRRSQDPLVLGALRVLEDVNDLQLVLLGQIL